MESQITNTPKLHLRMYLYVSIKSPPSTPSNFPWQLGMQWQMELYELCFIVFSSFQPLVGYKWAAKCQNGRRMASKDRHGQAEIITPCTTFILHLYFMRLIAMMRGLFIRKEQLHFFQLSLFKLQGGKWLLKINQCSNLNHFQPNNFTALSSLFIL